MINRILRGVLRSEEELQTNAKFMDVCKMRQFPLFFWLNNPMFKMIQEYSLSRRYKVSNLLGRDYAIKLETK